MWWYWIIFIVLAVLVSRKKRTISRHKAITDSDLTDMQRSALMFASFDKPIYGENPKHRHAQMPDDARCFSLRTVESLVKRGYLRSDGQNGYLLTKAGNGFGKSTGIKNP